MVTKGSTPLGLVATVAMCAVSTGLTAVTATVLLVDALKAGSYPENLSLRLYLLFGGTLGGILLSAWAAWRLLEPIASTYRRGGLAMVFGFATVLLMLVCIPVHQHFGRPGLAVMLAASGAVAVLLSRRAKQLGASE